MRDNDQEDEEVVVFVRLHVWEHGTDGACSGGFETLCHLPTGLEKYGWLMRSRSSNCVQMHTNARRQLTNAFVESREGLRGRTVTSQASIKPRPKLSRKRRI